VRSDTDGDDEGSRILILRDVTEVLESRAARDTFVGMLSHEIRTPITTIFGTSQVLLRPLDEELRTELTRDLASETDRLYRLVEDLLVLSRYEREALDLVPEPVLLQRLIPSVAGTEQGRWPGVTIDLDVEPDLPPVVADATYVEQVIRNLVSNGAKYGGSGARIRVVARADSDGVTVEVGDSGPGIPAGAEETIFHLYERLPDARQSGAPGAGIGLFVCRRLVELMGGRIWARNAEGGGAVLAFSLPRYGEALLPVQPAPPRAAAVAPDAGLGVASADVAPREAVRPADPPAAGRAEHYPPPAFPQIDDPTPSPAT
jgi:signal transduction histidine kinase